MLLLYSSTEVAIALFILVVNNLYLKEENISLFRLLDKVQEKNVISL